ncbi:MAG: hypothetical protein ACOH2K_13375 [Burkholderiaceae bacterium]
MGAASSSTIVLPNGQLWSVVSSAGVTRLVKAKLAAQTADFSGSGKNYTLVSSSAACSVSATATATVIEKASLSGTLTTIGSKPEAYALAYQRRYDTPAALADFASNWQATLGPGTVNWSINATGALTGTRTTGCTYQLILRSERKAVVDVAATENCSGTLVQL